MTHEGRVLVVDDDEAIRETLREILADEGYRVECVENGEEALAALRTGPFPCLVLLDLMMPIMDGHAFLRELSQDEGLREGPPIVVITAGSAPVGGLAGAKTVLHKPVSVDRILAIVHQYC